MKAFVESFGRAPVALFVIAIFAGVSIAATRTRDKPRPDLVVAVFAQEHLDAYEKALPSFEHEHGVDIELQLTDWHALENRLQNAMLSGTEVPDMVELIEGSLGFFTRGPAEDVGFLDLSERIVKEGLDKEFVPSRFSLWTAHERIYALPHDVHPVMLVYRRDLVEQLGIDVAELDTWEKFVAMAKQISVDENGDGRPDRFALDLPIIGSTGLWTLLLQRGVQFFDKQGEVAFDDDLTVQTIRWYVEATRGPNRISIDCGWGQPLMKAMSDGVALFYLAPDWRTRTIQNQVPNLHGKLAVMPLPAWEPGGRRTSIWGGTGLAISRDTKRPELAWKLAKHLYFDKTHLEERFRATHILPPFQSAWSLPELAKPMPYYSNQAVGSEYAKLAPDVPPFYSSPVHRLALTKIDEAYQRSAQYYEAHGERGFDAAIRTEVERAAAYVRRAAARISRLREAH